MNNRGKTVHVVLISISLAAANHGKKNRFTLGVPLPGIVLGFLMYCYSVAIFDILVFEEMQKKPPLSH